VVEFKFPSYFVYGVCIEENARTGDRIAMYSRQFTEPLSKTEDLHGEAVREKICFVVNAAYSRKNADILRVIGKMDIAHLPELDRRFRSNMSGITEKPCWHMIEGDQRKIVPFLTRETAMLSQYGLPNMDFIRHTYDNDLYPWSAELLKRGPLDFDPDQFEAEMRALLG
jgi:hypothetical protein